MQGVCVYVWPDHYPQSCPPNNSIELNGSVYRFINGANPTERDFYSYYERQPDKDWGVDACKARGLSVLRTFADCGEMRKAIPALRKKRVAKASISIATGLVASTPSNSCEGHCTWWRSLQPSDVVEFFTTFDEKNEVGYA
jgi:hypothetical protein